MITAAIQIKPIRTEADYEESLSAAGVFWNAPTGTPEADALEVLAVLIDEYESKHYPVPPANPIDFLRSHMEEHDLRPADLGEVIGSRSHASEVLRRHRPLSLHMMRAIHAAWAIPLDILARPYGVQALKPKKTSKKAAKAESTVHRPARRKSA